MSSYESIGYDVADGVATIRFARPEAQNAWTRAMGLEIRDALGRAVADGDARVIAVTGEGKAFSAGADLKDVRPTTPEGDLDLGSALQQIYNPMILTIREASKPVVAVVNGAAAGFSCSLAMACDLVLAGESAFFLLAFSRVGLAPDGGASVTIPARTGYGRAFELAMLGDRLGARDALEWGLVNRVYPDGELSAEAAALCRRLAAGPAGSYAAIKRLHNLQLLPPLRAALGAEAAEQFARGLSAEYEEGVAAFLEKRDPDFRVAD